MFGVYSYEIGVALQVKITQTCHNVLELFGILSRLNDIVSDTLVY